MKIVYFIGKSHNFAESMVDFMEGFFPEFDKSYYIIDRKTEKILPMLNNVHRILSYKEFVVNKKLQEDLYSCDKIIISGLFTLQYVFPFFPKQILHKTYIQFWGGDFYRFRNKNIGNILVKLFDNICVKNCAGVINLVESEEKLFKKIFPYDKKFFATPVPGGPKSHILSNKYRKKALNCTNCFRRIIIGNSATPENQHEDVFKILHQIDLKDIEIICPLSYGNKDYGDYIESLGYDYFGDKFIPLREYMKYEKYVDILLTCQVGIYNNNRQQGMGNISQMFNLGKKVYISKKSYLWEYYIQFGYVLNAIEDIPMQSANQILCWDKEQQEQNFRAIENRGKAIYLEWKRILEDSV